MLELINVSKSFGNRKILDNINLKFANKEIIGILGPNGAGKSVLLKIIAGFLSPDKGRVYSNGKVGISIQDNSFYESLTVKQNLNYFANIYKVEDKKNKIAELIHELGLSNFVNSNVSTLSGGTKKKLDLACSLLNDPSILVLDEPFTGLDRSFTNELVRLLKKLNERGLTLIISSHVVPSTFDLCNRFLLVEDGSVSPVSKEIVKEMF